MYIIYIHTYDIYIYIYIYIYTYIYIYIYIYIFICILQLISPSTKIIILDHSGQVGKKPHSKWGNSHEIRFVRRSLLSVLPAKIVACVPCSINHNFRLCLRKSSIVQIECNRM